jgi:hypothetical protein
VWGQPIAVPRALPGDVLQLQNYAVVATTLHTAHFDDGTTHRGSESTSRTYANHIAIVAARPEERSVSVLEQVPGSGPRVRERVILLRDCGPIIQRVFRWEHDATGQVRPATVVQTTRLRVTGLIRIYRPTTPPVNV